MAKCKDCLHCEACSSFSKIINSAVDVETGCEHFKNRTDFTEVVRCKDCKYGIWDEEEQMWECVVSAFYSDNDNNYVTVREYNKEEHFCSYGERKTDG